MGIVCPAMDVAEGVDALIAIDSLKGIVETSGGVVAGLTGPIVVEIMGTNEC